MNTHERIIAALDDLQDFAGWAENTWKLGTREKFTDEMKDGQIQVYVGARVMLLSVIPELRDASAAELMLRVTRTLHEYVPFTENPAFPFAKESSHMHGYYSCARDALKYWAELRGLALRLEAEGMVADQPTKTETVEPIPQIMTLDYAAGYVWERCPWFKSLEVCKQLFYKKGLKEDEHWTVDRNVYKSSVDARVKGLQEKRVRKEAREMEEERGTFKPPPVNDQSFGNKRPKF